MWHKSEIPRKSNLIKTQINKNILVQNKTNLKILFFGKKSTFRFVSTRRSYKRRSQMAFIPKIGKRLKISKKSECESVCVKFRKLLITPAYFQVSIERFFKKLTRFVVMAPDHTYVFRFVVHILSKCMISYIKKFIYMYLMIFFLWILDIL